MKTKKNHYIVLGVPRSESSDGIRKAYRRLAKASHPDCTGADETSSFRDVAEAYDVLSDPEKRRRYDNTLDRPRVVVSRPVAGGWRPPRDAEPEPLVPEDRFGVEPEPLIPRYRSHVDLRSSRPPRHHGLEQLLMFLLRR